MSTLALIATSTLTAVCGAAAMYVPARLALRDARTYRDEADKTFGAAESLADEVERTRNLPWHYAAIEAAPEDKPVIGEVLHVEHATGELPTVADESEHKPNCPDLFYCPTVGEVESGCHGGFDVCCAAPELHQPVAAEGLARLADEVGLAQALSEPCCTGHGDEPCAPDSGLVPPYCCSECPSRSAVLALSDEPEHDDEDAPADDTDRPGLHLVLLAIPVALWDRAREWWRSLWAKPEPYRGRHWVAGTQHTGQYPIVPAQREAAE